MSCFAAAFNGAAPGRGLELSLGFLQFVGLIGEIVDGRHVGTGSREPKPVVVHLLRGRLRSFDEKAESQADHEDQQDRDERE